MKIEDVYALPAGAIKTNRELVLSNGRMVFLMPQGASDYQRINDTMARLYGLGGGAVYLLPGNAPYWDIRGQINHLYSGVSLFGIPGVTKLRAKNSLGSDIIRVGDGGTTTVTGVMIAGLDIDGNVTNQTTATYGIHMYQLCHDISLQDIFIHDINGKAFYSNGLIGFDNTAIRGRNLRTETVGKDSEPNADYDGWDTQNTKGLQLDDVYFEGRDDCLDIGKCDDVTGSNWNLNGRGYATGCEIDNCSNVAITGIKAANTKGYAVRFENMKSPCGSGIQIWNAQNTGFDMKGCQYGNFQVTVRRSSQAVTNVDSAIFLWSVGSTHCIGNTVHCTVLEDSTGSKFAKYGIRETDSNQNYNQFFGVVTGAATAAVSLQGANSTSVVLTP